MRRLLMLPMVLVTTGSLLTAAFAAAGAASASTGSAAPDVIPGGPIIRAHSSGAEPYPTVSLNWSGYAVTAAKGKTFNYVHSTFVQPAITCTGQFTYTSNWVGLDGFENGTVEQDGTAAYCGGSSHMTPVYYAWFELFPHPTLFAFRVRPGDHMTTSVRYTGGKFHLALNDATSGKHASYAASCSDCQRASAEWIVERPAVCTNKQCTTAFLTKLADFHTATMSDDQAQYSGGALKGPLGFTNYPIDMVSTIRHQPGFISLDQVSSVSHNSFSVLWNRSGIVYPIKL